MSVKQVLCLLLCLLCIPLIGIAEEKTIEVKTAPHRVDFSFSLPEHEFVYVRYDTRMDTGEMVLYAPDGNFQGTCWLPGTDEAIRMGLNVLTLTGREIMRTTVMTQAEPEEKAPAANLPAQRAANKAQDVEITPVEGGIHYSFSLPGRDSAILRCKSPQEWHSITLYAGEDYRYEGDVRLPCTYPDDAITFTLLSGTGTTLCEETVNALYLPPAEPTTLDSRRLSGVIVCIDPGHQRTTQVESVPLGPNFKKKATTVVGMAKGVETLRRESQLVLEIGIQLRNALMKMGAGVCMTREVQDTFVGMLERADIPNSVNADFVLRLHCNSRGSGDTQGIEVYCPLNSSYAMEVADEKTYRAMGETMLAAMQEATGMQKGVCTLNNNYVGNNWSMMPSFLIEMGYMTNMEEDLKLSCPEYQQRLVNGRVEGVIRLARMRGLIE